MIRLDVDNRCYDCPLFTAASTADKLYADDIWSIVSYTIKCIHREECDELRQYLNKEEQRERD